LVVGGAVHAGLAHLLAAGQQAVDSLLQQRSDLSPAEVVGDLFRSGVVRQVEDEAVAAALKAFDEDWGAGVELDPDEAASRARQAGAADPGGTLMGQLRDSLAQGESPIVIDFSDLLEPGK
jgi:hypothetical protein